MSNLIVLDQQELTLAHLGNGQRRGLKQSIGDVWYVYTHANEYSQHGFDSYASLITVDLQLGISMGTFLSILLDGRISTVLIDQIAKQLKNLTLPYEFARDSITVKLINRQYPYLPLYLYVAVAPYDYTVFRGYYTYFCDPKDIEKFYYFVKHKNITVDLQLNVENKKRD